MVRQIENENRIGEWHGAYGNEDAGETTATVLCGCGVGKPERDRERV